MIAVTIGQNGQGNSFIFMLKGHARKDVCCAATSYAYLAAQCVKDMYNKGQLRKKPSMRLKEGDIIIVAKPAKQAIADALHLFLIIRTGIRLLEHNYPEEIFFSIPEKSEHIEESST